MTNPETSHEQTAARRIVDALEQGATLIDEGTFTLDRARALEKLAAYRLSETDAWILIMVQVGNLLGATSISIVCQATFAEVLLANVTLPSQWLGDLLGGVFVGGDDATEHERRHKRARQKLAIAYAALLEFDPDSIELVCMNEHGQVSRLSRARGDERDIIERSFEPTGSIGTKVRVVYTSRPGGRQTTRQMIYERCCYSKVPVSLERQVIQQEWSAVLSSGTRPILPVDVVDGAGRVIGIAGIGLRDDPSDRGVLLVQVDGIVVEKIALEDTVEHFIAFVDVDLRLDLSQSKVVRDAAFYEVVGWVRATYEGLVAKWRNMGSPRPEPHPVPALAEPAPNELATSPASAALLVILGGAAVVGLMLVALESMFGFVFFAILAVAFAGFGFIGADQRKR